MSRISLFIATWLDGFIERKDGGIEWFHYSGHREIEKGEDSGYKDYKHNG